MTRYGVNRDLPPLPSDEEVLAAVAKRCAEIEDTWADARSRGLHYLREYGASALDVAAITGVVGAARLGRGAVKGSWSGYMSEALRISPRLRSLAKQGRLVQTYNRDNRRLVYRLPKEEYDMDYRHFVMAKLDEHGFKAQEWREEDERPVAVVGRFRALEDIDESGVSADEEGVVECMAVGAPEHRNVRAMFTFKADGMIDGDEVDLDILEQL